jgi:short-subunit dehydrogenase
MKRALITGATSGIGLEFAQRLHSEGYNLTLVARNSEKLSEISDGFGKCKIINADLSTLEGIEKVCNEVSRIKYNLVVNNAGVGLHGALDRTSSEKLNNMIMLNCNAVMMISQAFLKRGCKGDALIITSSVASFLAVPNEAVYNATKAFDSLLGQTLWQEERKKGIYVMTLYPGITETNFFKNAGWKGEIPWFLMQDVRDVVSTAMFELSRRERPIVISGWMNSLFLFLIRFLPRKSVLKMMHFFEKYSWK